MWYSGIGFLVIAFYYFLSYVIEVVNMPGGYQWTKQEVRILKGKYPTHGSDIPELDRTRRGIQGKAHGMGISYNRIKHIQMSNQLKEYLSGLLLGDGYITNKKHGTAYYRHSDNYKEYIVWLKKKLEFMELPCSSVCKNRQYYCLRSQHAKELEDLYHKWYPNGNKRIPQNLRVTPIILKNWYVGDGSRIKNSNNNGFGLIISSQFDPIGKSRMVDKINQDTPMEAHDNKRTIYFTVSSHEPFFNYILRDEPEIPPGYEYKFPDEYL